MMTIQIKPCRGGFFWRIKATNGKTLAHSEVYNKHASALKTAKRVQWAMMDLEDLCKKKRKKKK